MNTQKEKTFVENLINKGSSFYIYGAGTVGKLVYKRLVHYEGVKKCKGFIVSDNANNQHKYCGLPVIALDDSSIKAEVESIVLAAFPRLQAVFKNNAIKRGFKDLYGIDESLYLSMESGYIFDFQRGNSFDGDKYDVLLMSSDNLQTSGAFRCLCDLSQELNRHGIAALIVLPCFGFGEELLIERGIPYTYVHSQSWAYDAGDITVKPCAIKGAINSSAVSQLCDLIDTLDIKMVHNNTIYTYVGALAADKTGIPYIWHIREDPFAMDRTFEDEKYTKEVISGSTDVLYVSGFMRGQAVSLGFADGTVVYDGIDVNEFCKEREIFLNPVVRILMMGYIVDRKGQMELLQAINIVRKKTKEPMEITFIGDAEPGYLATMQDFIQENNLEGIRFRQRTQKPAEAYWENDIVVVASWTESFGRVTVEAQSAGCLVVGSNAGATPELIEDGVSGFIFPVKDYRSLAGKIEAVLSDKVRARTMAKEGQKRVHRFSKQKNAEAVRKIYQKYL